VSSAGELADRVLAAPARLGEVRVLAIDGPSGSGKTTLAVAVCDALRERGVSVGLVPADHFATWDEPAAWWPRLESGVLAPLAVGEPGRYRRTDWSGDRPRLGEWVPVPVPEVLVLEGVTTGRASVRDRLSVLHWVELPGAAARLDRSVGRDGERYRGELARWQRYELGWFAVDGTATARLSG
jgi:energy-coupling factor transporter ATP-binding protein EcfA2